MTDPLDLDTFHTLMPMCPSCGKEVSDDPYGDFPHYDEDHRTECGHCGVDVVVTVNQSITYTTKLDRDPA